MLAQRDQLHQPTLKLFKFGDSGSHMLQVLLQDLRRHLAIVGAIHLGIEQLLNFLKRHVQAAACADLAQSINVMRAVGTVSIA